MYIQQSSRTLMAMFAILVLTGCSATIPSMHTGDETLSWSQQVTDPALKLEMEWAKPMQSGPHPTVIVHPGRGQSASDLRGVIKDLAHHGYLAVAVDYKRMINGDYQKTMFPWRQRADSKRALEIILDSPLVDHRRVATLGFSLGGAHSLLLAANNPEIQAVIAYYPMTDFPDWISEREKNPFWRLIFNFAQWNYNAESPLHSEETHLRLLSEYSAINHTDRIRVPVLIIHGDEDGISPLHHSEQLQQELNGSGYERSSLIVVRNAGHGFNVRRSEQSELSWNSTLSWLDRHLIDTAQLGLADFAERQDDEEQALPDS